MTQNQPIYILPEDTKRVLGKDAQRNNIMAAKLVAETVKTTLGPKGMDKMIVDSLGDIIITNDGVTILEEMQIEHPAAKMIVEIAKTQEDQVGDGTTTAVILAGELLKNAEELLDNNIHPTVIAKGYRLAALESQKILEQMAMPVSINDEQILLKISETAMTGKGAESAKIQLSQLIVSAIKQVISNNSVDTDDIKIEKKVGGGVTDSELIKGLVLDKERVHSSMPKKVSNAKIALLDCPIEVKDTETDAKIQITDPAQLQSFIDQEEKMLKDLAQKIIDSGANVVFCQKGIDDIAQYFLAKADIFAVRRVKKSDLGKLSRATGAKIITQINELNENQLGQAGLVEEVKISEDEMIYIKECPNPKAVTLFIRGGTQHVVDEIERAVKDAMGDIVTALKNGKVVAGAGAPEIELAQQLRQHATTLSGREQLAVQAFADAIEIVPRTLAENAGLDPIDTLTELKSKHSQGTKWAGLDIFSGNVVDAWEAGVVEPLKIKTQAVKSASEVSEMILRIDDVIAGSSSNETPQMPSQMPPMM